MLLSFLPFVMHFSVAVAVHRENEQRMHMLSAITTTTTFSSFGYPLTTSAILAITQLQQQQSLWLWGDLECLLQ